MTDKKPQEQEIRKGRGGKRPGSGRKKTGRKNLRKQLWLPPQTWDIIDTHADRLGLDRSKAVGEMVREYDAAHPKEQ